MARASFFFALFIVLAVFVSSHAQNSQARDSRKHSDETIVVPAGTRITVDISEENPPRNATRSHPGKVANIVQVGSTVAIPALSIVTIHESAGLMELTDVTINGVRYELQTDHVAI